MIIFCGMNRNYNSNPKQECIPVGCVPSAASGRISGGGVPGPGGMYQVPGGCTWSGDCTNGPGGVYLVPVGVPGPGGMYLVPGGCTWSGGSYLVQRGVPGLGGTYLVQGGVTAGLGVPPT